ncbi:ACT domain-containing protein [Mangrovitalea sediminis]|uniref:ACT domain-containing protein n=1 Tax=Mangrovitalea sediminis TaxID=1982043 RepID=UPI000BE5B66A|nr:ACT domain-containing protein [Mangrovitalea sediminis]
MNPQSDKAAECHQIQFQMQAEPAALERALQVIRIRGFGIESMKADLADGLIDLALIVRGTRPIGTLMAQLDKLQTVLSVVADSTAYVEQRKRA